MNSIFRKKKEVLSALIIASSLNMGATRTFAVDIESINLDNTTPIILPPDFKVEPNQKPIEFPVKESDNEAPTVDIESLKVSNNDAKPGDIVKISIKVTDDISGVNIVRITFRKPISGTNQDITLEYNETTGEYEGEFNITDEIQSGNWKVLRILVQDKECNLKFVYNKNIVLEAGGELADLSKGDIKVSDTKITTIDQVDVDGPTIDLNSINVDEKEAVQGDKVKLSFKAFDKSGVESIWATYMGTQGFSFKHIELTYNEESGYFEGCFDIDANFKAGYYRLWQISAKDKEGNYNNLCSTEFGEGEKAVDLSSGNFTVK